MEAVKTVILLTLMTLLMVWIGGMFFAHQVLRPVAVAQFEPPQRLPLWDGVFSRFFPWVWAAIIVLMAVRAVTLGWWYFYRFAVRGPGPSPSSPAI